MLTHCFTVYHALGYIVYTYYVCNAHNHYDHSNFIAEIKVKLWEVSNLKTNSRTEISVLDLPGLRKSKLVIYVQKQIQMNQIKNSMFIQKYRTSSNFNTLLVCVKKKMGSSQRGR